MSKPEIAALIAVTCVVIFVVATMVQMSIKCKEQGARRRAGKRCTWFECVEAKK
jgi:hypothetical protein